MLVSNIEIIQEHQGGIQRQLDFDTIRPFLENAEQMTVGPLIGPELGSALAGTSLSAAMTELRRHVQRAISLVGLHESMVSMLYQFGNAGLSKFLPKDAQKLAMWEVDIILNDAARRADEAIEQLMGFLASRAADLPVWTNCATFREQHRYLIPSAALLQESLPEVAASARLYAVLKLYMPGLERKLIAGVTGRPTLDALRNKLVASTALTVPETELWRLCRDWLAPLTLHAALPFIRVKFMPEGIRIEQSFKGLKDEKAADDHQITALRAELWERAELARGELKRYLNETASGTVFPAYFSSTLYVAPGSTAWTLPDNDGKRHFRL